MENKILNLLLSYYRKHEDNFSSFEFTSDEKLNNCFLATWKEGRILKDEYILKSELSEIKNSSTLSEWKKTEKELEGFADAINFLTDKYNREVLEKAAKIKAIFFNKDSMYFK